MHQTVCEGASLGLVTRLLDSVLELLVFSYRFSSHGCYKEWIDSIYIIRSHITKKGGDGRIIAERSEAIISGSYMDAVFELRVHEASGILTSLPRKEGLLQFHG